MSEKNETFITPVGIASFPYLWKENDFGTTPKFELTLLLDEEAYASSEMKAIRAAVKAMCISEHGEEPKNLKGWQSPFKKGDDKFEDDPDKYAIYEGMMCFTAKSTFLPGVVDKKRQPILDEEEFYAGCAARMSVNLFPWTYGKKKGIGLGLQFVQKTAEGERIGGGRRSAEDVFGDDLPSTGDDDSGSDEDYDV